VSGSKKTKKRGDHAEHDPAAKSAPAEAAAPADPLRCVIVEDQRMFSQLLVTMLRAGPGLDLEIAATAETVAEGIAACEAHAPELLILDLALADGRGEAVAERLLEHNPGAKVIVPSARDRLAEQLSHREQEVLLLVGQGLQSKQIAERLQISHNTVQSHRKKIAFKLGTEGMELTRYAYHYWQRVAGGGCDSPA
jgi:DNA-binding NarL/FixJ family response regulator